MRDCERVTLTSNPCVVEEKSKEKTGLGIIPKPVFLYHTKNLKHTQKFKTHAKNSKHTLCLQARLREQAPSCLRHAPFR